VHIPQKFFRPILSRPHGLKFFPAKNFWFESWYGRIFCRESFSGQIFSARNLKILKKFGLKVENFKKCWRESWKKSCQFGN
jgi:hypothetical protein